MSVKLSELLEHSVSGLNAMATDFGAINFDYTEERLLKQADALRAIAPALVEAVQNHGNLYQTHVPENCIGCKVHRALAEAGVTCE